MAPPIYHLPLELVRKVTDESSSRDIAALALTSRHFHAWANPCLYEHNLKHENANAAVWAADKGRLGTLLHLRRAQIGSPPDFVKKLWIKKDVSKPDWPVKSGVAKFTLLHLAVRNGHDDVAVWLLQQGADIEAHCRQLCDCPSVRWRAPYWTPLHLALCHSQEKTVKILSHDASLQTRKREKLQALHTAAAHGLTSTIIRLSKLPDFDPNVRDSCNQTPLHYAVKKRKGHTAIKTLIKLGAKVDGVCKDGPPFAPLYGAIVLGNFKAAVSLLKAGARDWEHTEKVAQVKELLQGQSRTVGSPPLSKLPFHLLPLSVLPLPLLHLAARTNKEFGRGVGDTYEAFQHEIIRKLLLRGMDINERLSSNQARYLGVSRGTTPLMMAARYSSPTTVRLLIRAGADISLLDSNGFSALWLAIKYQAKPWSSRTCGNKVIKALLDSGAEVFNGSVSWYLLFGEVNDVSDATAKLLIDNMGPKNLTMRARASMALGLCCIYQKSEMYHAIKQNSRVEMTDNDIHQILQVAAQKGTTSAVVAFLRETCPGPLLKRILDGRGF